MGANNHNFRPVLPEDINMHFLRRLAREGRLYYDANEPSDELLSEDRQQQVMQYVEAISHCVMPAYVPYISLIWERIVTDPLLSDNLFIQKGRHQGLVNRYRVLAIVTVLQESGVYDHDRYTLLALHNILEHVSHKTSVYSSRLNYALNHAQTVHLKRVIKEISK